MEGFDTITMSYLASPISRIPNMQTAEYLSMPQLEVPEQPANFDTETFVRYVDLY
jgi:hypothetical protein